MSKLRSGIVAIAVVATVGVGISGCSSGTANASSDASACQPSKGKVTLDYWGWQDHGKAAVEEFNKTHKNIQVSTTRWPVETSRTRTTSTLSRRATSQTSQ
jgi:multiple sugar transport system substrate-binding protein